MSDRPHDPRTRVFISHQWRDKQLADRLARDLEGLAEVWIDFRGLRPGDRIQPTIDEVLHGTDLVLLLWTEHARRSEGVRREVEACLAGGVRLVPCILAYDERGNPDPPLDPPLDGILGIDFHHYGTGLAQAAESILHLQSERLPAESARDEHPGARMLGHLRGYLGYLANYRAVQGVPDRRAEWVERIVEEIERYVRAGGDPAPVRALLQTALGSEVDDPEGIGTLTRRLRAVLGENAPADGTEEPAAAPGDELARRVAAVVPAGAADAWLAQVDAYLASAPAALQALASYAWATGSQAGAQVVGQLQAYLADAEDLVPDRLGRYGRADDAWLIHNTAFRLVEAGVLPAAAVPVDWRTILAADHVVRAVIPPATLETLSAAVFQMLQRIAAEVGAYQPWFSTEGRGYSPTVPAPSSGGTWEDQMNRALLGTGLSVDG